MSIINNASPGSNVESLFAVDRAITKFSQNEKNVGKYLSFENLQSLVSPPKLFYGTEKVNDEEFKSLDNPKKKVKEAIEFWGDAGLWEVSEKSYRAHSVLDNSQNLPTRLLKLIANKKDYDLFEGNKIEPFLRFITFFLCIEEVTFSGLQPLDRDKAGELVAKLIDGDPVKNAMSLNPNERPIFFAYAERMGFLEQIDKDKYFVDPTRAVKVFLPDIFLNKKAMFFDEFLNQLNYHLPIFDGGKYRLDVERKMIHKDKDWSPEKGIRLSSSLSIAIERMSRERLIRYDLLSDSETRYCLVLPNGKEETFSEIQFWGDK